MYRYDEFDQRMVNERVEQFRDQVARRLLGEITEDEFKPLRLMNGLYSQLHAYMLRVSIPYGMLSSTQLRKLARVFMCEFHTKCKGASKLRRAKCAGRLSRCFNI